MKKRNQHYVFQGYLRKWHNKEKLLWCLKDGKIDAYDTINIAQEEDFYRILKLNDDEIKFLEFFWSDQTQIIQQQLMSHLHIYQISFVWEKKLALCKTIVNEIKNNGSITQQTTDDILALLKYLCNCLKNASDECDTNGISAKHIWLSEINNLNQLLFIAGATAKNKDNAEIIEFFDSTMKMLEEKTDEATNDIEEDFLSSIESETSRWMRAFKKRNFAEIEKQDKREFFFDIAIHYFRTKAARDAFQKRFQDIFSNTTLMEKFCKLQPNVNPANIRPESLKHPIFWGWQAALANSLYTKKACITLLVNETNTPLITCDRPLINLKANYEDLSQEVKNLAFYYPLYPSIAIIIDADSSSEEIDTVKLSKQDVEEYNKKVVKASHEFIFANEKGILETILKDRNRTNA